MTSGRAAGHDRRLFSSLRGYRPGFLPSDLLAGLAIAAVGLPSAIAYPSIAGLPAETGLYASIAPLIAYAALGPSRRLIVGPDAATMTVLAAVLVQIAAGLPPGVSVEPAAIASAVAIGVGLTCLAARFLGLGVIASFLSRPILTGFFAGISLSIIVGQIGRFTGLKIQSEGLIQPVVELLRRLPEVHMPSVLLGVAMLAVIAGLKRMNSVVPGPVAVIVLATGLSALVGFSEMGIRVVEDVPTSLPALALPDISGVPLDLVVSGAISTFLVSFGAGIITARSFAQADGQTTDPDRELEGFSAANIAAGFFGAFPVTASDSRTAVNLSVGGRTQVASIAAALALVLVILFLSDALRILPVPALGAILVAAAAGLIDLAALRRLWQVSRTEFGLAIAALWAPIALGVLQGVGVVVGITLLHVLWKMMHPRDALLGLRPGRDGFYKLHRTPDARPVPGLSLCLLEGSLLFFNAETVRARMAEIAAELPAGTRWFVLDTTAITQIDTTAATALDQIAQDFAAVGIRFGLAELNAEVRELLDRSGVLDRIGRDMLFEDLGDVLRAYQRTESATPPPSPVTPGPDPRAPT